MRRKRYIVYEEITPWPWWAGAVVWLASLGAAVPLAWRIVRDALQGVSPGELPGVLALAGITVLLALTPPVVQYFFGRLVVRVTRTSLVLRMGYGRLIEKVVPFREIRDFEPVTYSPLKEFGGWGIRFGFGGGKRAWTARGDRALVLSLDDGTELYVGSDHPERLAERLRVAMGGRKPEASGG